MLPILQMVVKGVEDFFLGVADEERLTEGLYHGSHGAFLFLGGDGLGDQRNSPFSQRRKRL